MYRPDSSDSKNSDRDRPDSGYKGGASSRERESFGSESSTDSHAQFKVPSHMGSCSSPKHSAFSNGATTGGVRPSSGGSSVGVQQGSGSGPVSIPVPLHSRRNSEAKSFSFGDDIMEDMSCSPQWDESLLSHDMGGVGRGQRVPTAIRSLPLSLPIPRPNSGDRRPNSGERCRPASAEKRRWLARVSLLKADSKDSMSRHPDIPDAKAAKLAADDQLTVDYFIKGKHPVLHIEYLSWMGQDPILGHSDEGSITCPSCAKHIGTWCWMGVGVDAGVGDVSMELVGGSMAADILELPSPQFRILRNTVQLADLPLDSTPMSTPRLEGGTPRLDGSGSGAGGPTSREERDSLDMSIDRGTGTATATSAITGAGYGSIL